MPIRVYIWSKAPFARLLLPLVIGIYFQWAFRIPPLLLFISGGVAISVLSLASFMKLAQKFRSQAFTGLFLQLIITVLGGLMLEAHSFDPNKPLYSTVNSNQSFIATLEEPLVEKANSYKALASIARFEGGDQVRDLRGHLIVYLKKDSLIKKLRFGSRFLFQKNLQPIQNSGNPGAFDYRTFCLRQGITHQVYLIPSELIFLKADKSDRWRQFILDCRSWVVSTLRIYLTNDQVRGLAEALLIGYKDDLDKSLVQSYTNTGVVHIIAISGMHLALIYSLLLIITRPLARHKKLRWLQTMVILAALWVFTVIAGAQASVTRSAVMFTCIALSNLLSKKPSVYHSLTLSAFILLCYNPFWLWDVGFQLSYAAVVSIVLFYQPVYHWFYFQNKFLDGIWKIMAIAIAAQIITTPFSLFYFHQFPVLFLLTNLVAVPLSSLVLFGEIALLSCAFLPWLATLLGRATSFMIELMNSYIQRLETVSFSLWEGFSISGTQTLLLLAATLAGFVFMLHKQEIALWVMLLSGLFFISLRSVSFYNAERQSRLVVYNVPKQSFVSIITGRESNFVGDITARSSLTEFNFHIKPSYVQFRTKREKELQPGDYLVEGSLICIPGLSHPWHRHADTIDFLILSGKSFLPKQMMLKARVKQVILDSSIPLWKATAWQALFSTIKARCWTVVLDGGTSFELR